MEESTTPKKPRGRPVGSVKKTTTQNIEAALGVVEDAIALIPKPTVDLISQPIVSEDAKNDYIYARENLRSLLEKGNSLLNGITMVAEGTDQPRVYEVAGNLLKTLLEGTRELMTLQKDFKDVEKKSIPSSEETGDVTVKHAETVNNFVMETPTLEVLKMLEKMKESK